MAEFLFVYNTYKYLDLFIVRNSLIYGISLHILEQEFTIL